MDDEADDEGDANDSSASTAQMRTQLRRWCSPARTCVLRFLLEASDIAFTVIAFLSSWGSVHSCRSSPAHTCDLD
jgi:hypothetical protein